MTDLKLSEINIYPVKSLGGISLQSSLVEERGLRFDRRWLLVDEQGVFMTQRDYPEMALLRMSLSGNEFIVKHKSKNNLSEARLPFIPSLNEKINVVIWDDRCDAAIVSNELNEWFSDALGLKCRLVYMTENEERIVEKTYFNEDRIVSFADAYPFLIIGQSSLDDLNSRLTEKLPMNRFRTNFVFTGGAPFDEDLWKDFSIGDVRFRAVKPCARCVITTTDQESAVRSAEPLKTLSTYRRFGNKVMFGMNLIAYSNGTVSVGDSIQLEQ